MMVFVRPWAIEAVDQHKNGKKFSIKLSAA